MATVLAVDALKDVVDTGKTAVNSGKTKLDEHAAKVLVEDATDDESMKYRCDEAVAPLPPAAYAFATNLLPRQQYRSLQ